MVLEFKNTGMRLERFDASKHLKSSSGLFIVLQGRRGSGKSTLLNALLHRMKDSTELMIAMTPTVSQQEAFRQMTPACLVHDHLNIEAIAALLNLVVSDDPGPSGTALVPSALNVKPSLRRPRVFHPRADF